MRRGWSRLGEAERRELLRLHLEGMSQGDIAQCLGCHINTVGNHLKKLGPSGGPGRGLLQEKKRRDIFRLHAAGMRHADIAEYVGCHVNTVDNHLRRSRPPRRRHESRLSLKEREAISLGIASGVSEFLCKRVTAGG